MNMETIFDDLPTLETERLILRKITFDDIEDMFEYCSNDEVTKYVTWETHQSIAETKEFVKIAHSQYVDKMVAPWAIEYKENGKMIGTVDFVWWRPAHRNAEIGCVISQDYWSKGISTEAVKKVLQFGFRKMDLVRIQARCFTENIGSAKVLEKVGMSFEGILRKGMFVKGKYPDLKMYSILREEFFEDEKSK